MLQASSADAPVTHSVKVYGTDYSIGSVVILEKNAEGLLKVGLVRIIIILDGQPVFGCSTFLAGLSRCNFYVAIDKIKELETVKYEMLHDYYPLPKVGVGDSFRFSLHHFISDNAK